MAPQASSIVRRSLLYVPSSSEKMLAKSLQLQSDNITYDLEDSVAPYKKLGARQLLQTHLSTLNQRPEAWGNTTELCARVNAVSTPYSLEDLTSVATSPNLDAVLIPKVNSAADLNFVTDVLRHVAPDRHTRNSSNPIKIIGMIESAKAIMNLSEICKASPYLSGLVFAAEDFALDLSLTRTPSLTEFLYARSAIVTATKAFDIPSAIDLVCTSYKGDAGLNRLRQECEDGRGMGFNGKQCIHPSQVPSVQRLFSPSDAELSWATRIVIANTRAEEQGRGAWTLDGKMIDVPVVGKATEILERATKCGIDIGLLKERYKDQQPE